MTRWTYWHLPLLFVIGVYCSLRDCIPNRESCYREIRSLSQRQKRRRLRHCLSH